jgi:uncharacterized surface protein with fasciclin (FAS1) repeats
MQKNIIIGVAVVAAIVIGLMLMNSGSSPEVNEMPSTTSEANTQNETMEETNNNAVEMKNIVEVAVGAPDVSTLVAAVGAAGLVDTLQGAGPFTVFAPINQAFAALPAGTVESLLLPENIAALQGILTYHVVPGAVMAGDLTDGMVVETVNGETIVINVSATEGVTINSSAKVITADIAASNGVIHLIDAVLLPPTE